ncbi:hypothetical protein [Ktedonobacter racemifer]|uniref:Uncharacterized protein n=1 Tax=Ktedonobacter racemifer DSM 44963 TaxID=485913 RepID=D6TN49_KTERA|nr:hypothetical protein [Ktedonobacter racemifer]EFH87199.1 hypothetical protein Krac_8526 [Ktedonobacter racemifer DSM 44963]
MTTPKHQSTGKARAVSARAIAEATEQAIRAAIAQFKAVSATKKRRER